MDISAEFQTDLKKVGLFGFFQVFLNEIRLDLDGGFKYTRALIIEIILFRFGD